jgi:hypothetical protein
VTTDERLAAIESETAAIKEKAIAIEGKLDAAIRHGEYNARLASNFDDRLAGLNSTEAQLKETAANLATSVMRLSRHRPTPLHVVGIAALMAAIVGGLTATLAHDALAHKTQVELRSSSAPPPEGMNHAAQN